jgi:hypothetical protein
MAIWYGGELEKHQAFGAANDEQYRARIDRSNADSSLIKGGIDTAGAIANGATALMMPSLGYGGSRRWGGGGGIF